MNAVVQNQIDALEDLMLRHREAMSCRDAEDLLRFLRAFLATVQGDVDERRARKDYGLDEAREWERAYRQLAAVFDSANATVRRLQEQGYVVEGWDEFRQADADLRSILSVSVDQAHQAAESLRQGRGRTLSEVRDGLQSRLRTRG